MTGRGSWTSSSATASRSLWPSGSRPVKIARGIFISHRHWLMRKSRARHTAPCTPPSARFPIHGSSCRRSSWSMTRIRLSVTRSQCGIAIREGMPRYHGERLGNLTIMEAYIYPTPISLRQSMKVTIYGLFYQGAPTLALHLSLEPQNPNARLVVESTGQRHEYVADTSMTWVVSVPEGSAMERDDIGRLVLAWDLHGHRTRSDAK